MAKPPARSASPPSLTKNSGAVMAGAASQRRCGGGQVVQRCEVAAGEVPADDPRRRPVDHAPGGDAVVALEVQLVEPASLVVGQAGPGLEVEDAEGGQARFVRRVVEEAVDDVEGHIAVRLGEVEQVAHPHPPPLLTGCEALTWPCRPAGGCEPAQLGDHVLAAGRILSRSGGGHGRRGSGAGRRHEPAERTTGAVAGTRHRCGRSCPSSRPATCTLKST
jgi:hypothetical protein